MSGDAVIRRAEDTKWAQDLSAEHVAHVIESLTVGEVLSGRRAALYHEAARRIRITNLYEAEIGYLRSVLEQFTTLGDTGTAPVVIARAALKEADHFARARKEIR